MISSACMVVHSYCPDDPRVRREAEALTERGVRVDVICLRNEGEPAEETVGGVRYLRVPVRRKRGGTLRYFFEYGAFFLLAFCLSTYLAARRRYDLFQAHNMPDLLILCGLFHRLRGTRTILDLHDLVPEVYRTKFGLRPESTVIRVLAGIESLSIAAADVAITTSRAFRRTLIGRGIEEGKVRIVLNSPDEKIFHGADDEELSIPPPDELRLIYHGTLVPRSGLDTALHALSRLTGEIPGARLDIIGDGDGADDFRALAGGLGLGDRVRFHGHRPLAEIPDHIRAAHLGLVPNHRSVFTEQNLPTRIFEYLHMNRPVIAARLPGVLDYFGEKDLLYFTPDDADDLARAIREAHADWSGTARIVDRGRKIYGLHRWVKEKEGYTELVDRLCSPERIATARI